MRNILLVLLLVCGFVACENNDEIGFDIPVEFQKISFEPVPGRGGNALQVAGYP